jgi:hypothetical protein
MCIRILENEFSEKICELKNLNEFFEKIYEPKNLNVSFLEKNIVPENLKIIFQFVFQNLIFLSLSLMNRNTLKIQENMKMRRILFYI